MDIVDPLVILAVFGRGDIGWTPGFLCLSSRCWALVCMEVVGLLAADDSSRCGKGSCCSSMSNPIISCSRNKVEYGGVVVC